MADAPPKIVIRTHAPARGWIVGVSLVLGAVLGGYALFEYGRARAGFDQLGALRARAALQDEIRARDDVIRDLRRESGCALIMVTHSASAAAICDRRLRLEGGLLREEGAGPSR